MKKTNTIITLLFTLLLLLSMTGCECDHQYRSEVTKEATVTSTGIRTYTCSRCGHSYTETIKKIKCNWVKDYYVDDFGDKTKSAYVRGEFKGTFSNSATSGSNLTVYIFLDPMQPSMTTIRLLEYESHKATFTSSKTITLKTKDSSGKTNSYTLMSYSSGDLYSFDGGLANEIRNNKALSIVITTSSKYQSVPDTYNFKVDNIGLSDLIE